MWWPSYRPLDATLFPHAVPRVREEELGRFFEALCPNQTNQSENTMTIDQFRNHGWTPGQSCEYGGVIYKIASVDFAEDLVGLENPLPQDGITWVRCEHVILRQWPMNQGNAKLREIQLQRMDYEAQLPVDLRNLEKSSRFDQYMDHARQQLILRMRTSIYGKRHPDRHVIRYPKDWWEALKERFAPAWFRDRYPVRFTSVSVSLNELYPDIQPEMPHRHPVMNLTVVESSESPVW